MPLPAISLITGSTCVPPIRYSGATRSATSADRSSSSGVSETTSRYVVWPAARTADRNEASWGSGSPTSLQPTWVTPTEATSSQMDCASGSVRSSRVSMKMNSTDEECTLAARSLSDKEKAG